MNLLYKSTRNAEKTVTASEAILKGLADDGGLFMPVSIPKLDVTLSDLKDMTYQETAYAVMKQFLTDFTEEELKKFEYREISLKEIEEIKLNRVEEYLKYTKEDKEIIELYNKLNKGSVYEYKIILEEASDTECANINSKNIPGLICEYTVKRVYPYDTLNSLYGKVGNITEENKEYFLDKGYSLNDEVGLSYLEKQYDNYLKGEKSKYIVNSDNTLSLLESSKQGNDIYLSIDIDLQLKINDIIKENLDKKDKYKNTKYYNRSYVIISNPNTGEIIASTGISKIKDT